MILVQEGFFKKIQPGKIQLVKKDHKHRDLSSGLIPYELLQTGRRLHRSGSLHTCPCQLLPSHSQGQLPMQDIHLRRFRIRYISLCQRLLPTRSLQRICFGEKKKRVSITSYLHQEVASGEDRRSSTVIRIHQDTRQREDASASSTVTYFHQR